MADGRGFETLNHVSFLNLNVECRFILEKAGNANELRAFPGYVQELWQ
jgi:hypothetical protein